MVSLFDTFGIDSKYVRVAAMESDPNGVFALLGSPPTPECPPDLPVPKEPHESGYRIHGEAPSPEVRAAAALREAEALEDLIADGDHPQYVKDWTERAAARRAQAAWTAEQWAAFDLEYEQRHAQRRVEIQAYEQWRGAWVRMRFLVECEFSTRAIRAAMRPDADRAALTKIREWRHDRTNIAVLSGAAGCGKTVAAGWFGLHRHAMAFARAAEFAASSRYERDDREALLRPSHGRGLILDDLGAEYLDAKGSFLVDLDELIDCYYASQRPLVITTNLGGEAFRQRYGERIADRLRESGEWFGITEPSLRKPPTREP